LYSSTGREVHNMSVTAEQIRALAVDADAPGSTSA